ncbi:MAG TPA: LysR family transcriptional regulator, partial [Methylocella sp.]|nr:LysR family transcriptional regulator [Methylocella sp.]
MERLNYQHLFYFWNVAREGSITRACAKLRLAQPTISGQLAIFEDAIGEKLFRKEGRKLVLTGTGRTVFHYAEEIFALGRELTQTLKGREGGRRPWLNVGLVNSLPKLVVYRLIEPALRMPEPALVTCHEDKLDRLLAELTLHGFDLVLSDSPATSAAGVRIYNHLIGESSVAAFGTPELAERYGADFPRSLDGAPLLLQTANTELRRTLDQWLHTAGLSPKMTAEIEDSALLKTFGAAGAGLFFAPLSAREQIENQYRVRMVGLVEGMRERFFAITMQRKVQHPAVMAILES